MFKSLIGVVTDTAKIASAPIEILADVSRSVTKPVAEEMQNLTDDVKKELEVDD